MRASLRAENESSGHPALDDPHNTDALVSVIIPCHNYGYYLEDAILACSHPMETVVVDDGSELEESIEAVDALAERYRFRLVRQFDLNTLRTSYEAALSREASLKQSFSWRITTPVRYLASLLRFR